MSLYLVKWKLVVPGKTAEVKLSLEDSEAAARQYVAGLRLVSTNISAHIYELTGREVPP